ncbi:MAG: rRNA maturation RNase YbeY [Bacteroidetes bacterium]|nr:rRNA maturation RNase YbeY [Bacteroidota bacterium]
MTQPPFPLPFEENGAICFSSEEIGFELENEAEARGWLNKLIEQEGKSLRLLNFIFCPDDYLLRLNLEYLHHDTLTDILTFPYADPPIIEGDIFISIDRVRENAPAYGATFEQELHRVMAHGVLHLCGYGDKTSDEQKQMRQKEDEALRIKGFEV